MILPGSWSVLLEPLRGTFRRRGTFTMFTILATGMVAQTGRRTVVGMLSGARMAQTASFHAACRFFSHARWDIDQLGLGVLRLILEWLPGAQQTATLPDGTPVPSITVNVDDTLFRRWGKRVHAVFWTHDGAAQGKHKIGRGNRWVVAGIVVRLPFCSSPVCLPVLFRLWLGKGTASHVDLAAQMLGVLVRALPGYRIHGVGDAAYHGQVLVAPGCQPSAPQAQAPGPTRTTFTTRLAHNTTLYALAPPRPAGAGGPVSRATSWANQPTWPGRRPGARSPSTATATWTPSTSLVCHASGTAASATPRASVSSCGSPPRPRPTTWRCSPWTSTPPPRRS